MFKKLTNIGVRAGKNLGDAVLKTTRDVVDEARDEVMSVVEGLVGKESVSGEDMEKVLSELINYIEVLEGRVAKLERREKKNKAVRRVVKKLTESRSNRVDDFR